MNAIEERVLRFLDENGVRYEVFEHEPVYTCEKMAEYLRADQNLIAKSMIMKKSDGGLLLAVLPGEMRIDYAKLARELNTKSVSLAPIEEAEKTAGCSVGCVYPLGKIINLPTYFDKNLLKYAYVFFNPGSHTKSVRINTRDLIKISRPTIAEFGKPPRKA